MFTWVCIEGSFDLRAFIFRCGTAEDLNSLVGAVGMLDGCGDLLLKVTLRVFPLGEDDDSGIVPLCG